MSAPSLFGPGDPIRRGLDALAEADPVMARLIAGGMVPALRRRPAGFEGLAWIVVGQQLSTASAAAIWGRLRAQWDDVSPQAILTAPDEDLRRVGLSAGKIRTLRHAALAVAEGHLPLDRLQDMPADEAHARLTPSRASVPGRPTSICCSASAIPTLFRRATSPCRRPRGSRYGPRGPPRRQGP